MGPHLPPRQYSQTVVVLVPDDEGRSASELVWREPGGGATVGRGTGVRPRVRTPAPVVSEPARPAAADTAVVAEAVVDTAGPPAAPVPLRPRVYRIGPAAGEGKLWVQPLPLPPRELAQRLARTHLELVDSAVSAIVQTYIDSVLSAPGDPGDKPPSWTGEIFGKTFGIDEKYIYLGGLKIPAAILGLLPLDLGGRNVDLRAAHRLELIREDLQYAARRAHTLDDFKRAIRELRAERERQRELERNQRQPAPKLPPPIPRDTIRPDG